MNGVKHRAFREACSAGHVPPSLEQSERRDLFFVMHSLVVDSTFEQSENVAIICGGEFEQLLLTCIEECGPRSNRFKVRAAACVLLTYSWGDDTV